MSEKIILYGSPVCPDVAPVRGVLRRAQAPFEYVDIFEDSAANARVRAINKGNASVPTLVFSDGATLTEPSRAELESKLESLGYIPKAPSVGDALRENLLHVLIAMVFIGFWLFEGTAVLGIIGLVILVYIVFNGRMR